MIRNYKRGIILPILILFLIGNVLALDYLGSFKQSSCVELKQTCSSCTWINITISDPDGDRIYNNVEMTDSSAGTWIYDFCNTTKIGRYGVTGEGDIDNSDKTFAYYFEVTPSGFTGTLGFYFVIIVILFALVGLGFWQQEAWYIVFGGMGLMAFGIYTINFGIADLRDMFMTWGIGLFEIGVGGFLSIVAGLEKINNG